MSLESAKLEPYKSAALVIALQIESVTWACGEGIKVATVSLVGFEIGAGNIAKAKKITKLILIQLIIVIFILFTLIYCSKWYLVQAFTDDIKIRKTFIRYSFALVCLICSD